MIYKREIEFKAREAATEYKINEEKRELFIQGAVWAIDLLIRITNVDPLEELGGATKICDKIRLKDVNEFLKQISAYRKWESTK